MGIGCNISDLTAKLGYSFCDITYLQTALTHSSYSNEMRSRGFRAESNESLEFLGDAVLQIVISEVLYDKFRKLGEGTLTKYRQSLVCEKTLSAIAEGIELGKYLNVGTGEEVMNIRKRPKVLADALEAVIAAVYLDDRENGRGTRYFAVIYNLFSTVIENVISGGNQDYKSILQQFVDKNAESVLTYTYEESGPEHQKTFTATAYINNNKVGTGVGSTKRMAETEAAKAALKLFGII